MRSNRQHVGRPGDVVRVRELGPIKPKDGHDLLAIFLGAAPEGVEPDVPGFLKSLGWARTHVFELTLLWADDEVSRQLFTAESPREAAEAAIRAGQHAATREWAAALRGAQLRLMRLGPIEPDGRPHNGRGKVFFAWAAESGRPFDAGLLDSASAPSAGPSAAEAAPPGPSPDP